MFTHLHVVDSLSDSIFIPFVYLFICSLKERIVEPELTLWFAACEQGLNYLNYLQNPFYGRLGIKGLPR